MLIAEDATDLEPVAALLRKRGLEVDIVTPCEGLRGDPPDLILASLKFDHGCGRIAVSFMRPPGSRDAPQVLEEISHGEARALAAALEVSPEQLASRLRDLLPKLSRAATTKPASRRAPTGTSEKTGFVLGDFTQQMEELLIRCMLACAGSDREAARWLGLADGTMRSKMRKLGIRSPRSGKGSA